ncbi:hypothetical protein PFLUV_G00122180 [Xyrichtys novacula]|uniref:Uncharacterized protein n=1 Tax=Xyrichtys novacula TaxID=13765 RepID=A0AAV1FC54_XYRNO|nr:hypothetical protein PFLUV_G00122180 [Xyrichtys novacula]
MLLNLTTALTNLDVSRNNFSIFHFPQCLQERQLRRLNLSHSGITEVNSLLSASLEDLDLSYNSLKEFNNPPQTLKKLVLSNNHLTSLHFLRNLSHLKELNVDCNKLTVLVDETKLGLGILQQLDVLHAGGNSYHCDCALLQTVLLLNKTKFISEDPGMYLCATPKILQGTPIMKYSFGGCVKPPCERAETVKVGLVLSTIPEGKDCVVIREDRRGVDYKLAKDEEAQSYFFDQVVTVDNIQSLSPVLLQPLTEAVSSGYNGALLICGASSEEIKSVIDNTIIKQVLENLFSHMIPNANENLFISVSFLQFYPDGSAVDVLSSDQQALKLVAHPILGNVVVGLCEVCVSSAEEAYALYESCRGNLKSNTGLIFSRCSSLFSVAVEWKLDTEKAEPEICRSRLQLFNLAGGASRTNLRGVCPLVKILDHTQCEATTDGKYLPFLLKEVLTGNSQTALVYCLHPQGLCSQVGSSHITPLTESSFSLFTGLSDEETSAVLALAQKVKSLVTKAVIGHWCPRVTEQKIRDDIMDLRAVMISEGENEAHKSFRLAELTQSLQSYRTTKSKWHSSDRTRESTDTMKYLQEQLREEMEEHMREGKGSVEKVQERVTRIQQLRESIREEKLKSGAAIQTPDLCQQSHLEYNIAQERRRQLKEHHGRLIQEEVEKMERDLAQEQLPTEGPERELLVLTRERRVLVLQMEALRTEAQQAERDLQSQYDQHQRELHCLREESLQVFRVFRQVSEEHRKMSEGRYRGVLLEAVQDAVYLSTQNQELQAENKQLCKALGELKDALAVQSDPTSGLASQQQ